MIKIVKVTIDLETQTIDLLYLPNKELAHYNNMILHLTKSSSWGHVIQGFVKALESNLEERVR